MKKTSLAMVTAIGLAVQVCLTATEVIAQSSAQNLSMMAMTNACNGCDLSDSQLVGVDFSNKDLSDSNFSYSVADTANFSRATLRDVLFTGASFRAANFMGANIRISYTDRVPNGNCAGCSSGVFQTDIDFRSANFTESSIDITVYDTVFDGANFSQAERVLLNRDLCTSLHVDSEISMSLHRWMGDPSSYRNTLFSDIRKPSFGENALCSYGGNFSMAKFDRSNFSGDLFSGMKIVDGDLTDASFQGAILVGAIFVNSDLTRADFTNADLRSVNFEGANLTSVNFTGARLDGANLAGALLCETIDPKGTTMYFGCE